MINGIAFIIRKEDACQFFNEKNFSAGVKSKRNNSAKFYTDRTDVMVNVLSNSVQYFYRKSKHRFCLTGYFSL